MKETKRPYARKRFGQNFLVDTDIIDHIMVALQIKPDDKFIEIGPGRGALTKPLLTQCNNLNVVEIDWDMAESLEETVGKRATLTIHRADALEFQLNTISEHPHRLRIVGNLPYNISTPLLFHFLKQANLIKDMHFMLQKEVVDRIASPVGHSNYGRLSVMIQYHCKVEPLFNVPNSAFSPPPKVTSTFLRLTPYKTLPFIATTQKTFETVVRHAFSNRRKTLRNNLKSQINNDSFNFLNIDGNLRAEQLGVDDFVKISNYIDLSES